MLRIFKNTVTARILAINKQYTETQNRQVKEFPISISIVTTKGYKNCVTGVHY